MVQFFFHGYIHFEIFIYDLEVPAVKLMTEIFPSCLLYGCCWKSFQTFSDHKTFIWMFSANLCKKLEKSISAHIFSLTTNPHCDLRYLSERAISEFEIKTYRFSTPKTYSCSVDKRKISSSVNKISYKNGKLGTFYFLNRTILSLGKRTHTGW